MIGSNGNIISGEGIVYTITIGGFGNFGPTRVPASMSWSSLGLSVDGKLASEYANTNKEAIKTAISNNIENKWESFGAHSISIAHIETNNIYGTIDLDVGLYEYVDSKGIYVEVGATEKPLIFHMTITGFKTVPQSEIVATAIMTGKVDELASKYANSVATEPAVEN